MNKIKQRLEAVLNNELDIHIHDLLKIIELQSQALRDIFIGVDPRTLRYDESLKEDVMNAFTARSASTYSREALSQTAKLLGVE